LTPRLISSQVH